MLNNFTDKHFHLNLCETIKWKITTFIPISFFRSGKIGFENVLYFAL